MKNTGGSIVGKYQGIPGRWLGIACLLVGLFGMLAPQISAEEDGVFASIRHYDGVDAANVDAIFRLSADGFLPIMRASDGFVGYYSMAGEGTVTAISLFESAEQASASNAAAQEFVSEQMAGLLPNAPQIIEGTLGVNFVAALQGEQQRQVKSLYASMRVYEGVTAADVAESNRLAEELLLPIFQEDPSYFASYAIFDDVDTLVVLSLYDDAEKAHAAHAAAAEFVAEHLAEQLPKAPARSDARIYVAGLAALQGGENLLPALPAPLQASARIYDGVDPAHHDELTQQVADGYLPLLQASEGFVGYYMMLTEEQLIALSLFETLEQAAASNESAADFVAENLAALLPSSPRIIAGELGLHAFSAMAGEQSPRHASLRIYENVKVEDVALINDMAAEQLLPQMLALDGFFAQHTLHHSDGTTAAFSITESAAAAAAANTLGRAFAAGEVAQWLTERPLSLEATVQVAALAELHDGENLLAEPMSS